MSKPKGLLQGTLDLLILTILSQEPRTGWAISQRLRQMSNEKLQVSHGSLYPALHKLEAESWIEGQWTPAADGARASKVYSLTKAGRKELRKQVESWTEMSTTITAIVGAL